MKQKIISNCRGNYNTGILALASITLFHKVMGFLFFLIILNVDTIAGAPPISTLLCPPLPSFALHHIGYAHMFIPSPSLSSHLTLLPSGTVMGFETEKSQATNLGHKFISKFELFLIYLCNANIL